MEDKKDTPPKRGGRGKWILGIFLAVLAVLAVVGIASRHANTSELQKRADSYERHVSVVKPEVAPSVVHLVLPGQTQAFTQAPIFAQTNGYLKQWFFDIGAKVKKGDVLAEIDTPTVDQQLAQTRAQLSESEAALKLAQATYNRQAALLKRNVISAQDFDDATSDLQTKQSSVTAQQANVAQLQAQQNFNVIRAPFDGIVSARNTDIGALINSSTQEPLFVVSQVSPLRIYVQVPENLAALVKPGTTADLTFDTYPGRKFPAKVVATAGAIDETSRTLLTQLSAPNDQGELYPGSYTRVHLNIENSMPAITIPANTLLFRSEGAAVGVVGADGKVKIQPIKIGRDLGNSLEVTSGLQADDQVIVNPSDSLSTGDEVKAKPLAVPSPTPQTAK
jgi:RND family efflux transporter MFP subunit